MDAGSKIRLNLWQPALLLLALALVALGALFFSGESQPASAAPPPSPEINIDFLKGEESLGVPPWNGGGSFITGNIGDYPEGGIVNYRIDVTVENAAAAGTIEIEYGNIGPCRVWTAALPTNVSATGGGSASAGSLSSSGNDTSAILTVSFPSNGSFFIYFTLAMTNNAFDCATGSTQHVSIGTVTGDVKSTGSKTVPMPAENILRVDPFIVYKTFSDGNTANVNISLQCTAGELDPVIITVDDGTASISDPANFTVTGGNANTTCTATESSVPPGYATSNSDCLNVSLSSDGACTITNTANPGSIFWQKSYNPPLTSGTGATFHVCPTATHSSGDGGGAGCLTVVDNGTNDADSDLGDLKLNNVAAGTYHIHEDSPPAGYGGSCTINSIAVGAGQDVDAGDCATNSLLTGSLTVLKNVDTDGDGNIDIAGATDWTWDINGGEQNIATGQSRTLPTGNYTISEDMQSGYHVTNLTCNGQSLGAVTSAPVSLGTSGVTCTFTNTRDTGSLTVLKNVDTDGDGNINIAGATDWTWDISGGEQNIATGQSRTLPTGNYTIGEDMQSGYHVTDLTCNGQSLGAVTSAPVSLGTSGVTCTFTNTRDTGSLTVLKNVDTDGDGDIDITGATDWTWDINGGEQNIATGQSRTLPTGSYTISEDMQSGYHVTDLTCNGESLGAVTGTTLILGTSGVTCTFTNTRDTGSLTVIKLVDADNDGEFDDSVEGWTYNLDGDTGLPDSSGNPMDADGESIALPTGSYTVTENQQPGFHFVDLNCGGGAQTEDGATVNIVKGQVVTCTYRNAVNIGNLTVQKNIDVDGDGVADQFNVATWTWDLDGGNQNFATGASATVVAGSTHTISEDMQPGYHVINLTCGQQDLGAVTSAQIQVPEEGLTCTFTNGVDARQFIVEKDFTDGNTAEVFISLECTSGQVVIIDSLASEGDPATFTVLGYTPGTTCTAIEQVPQGYVPDQSDCVNVSLGNDGVCTIVNDPLATTLRIVKNVEPDDSSTTWIITVTGPTPFGDTLAGDDSTAVKEVQPGAYVITEAGGAGTDLADYSSTFSCTGASPTVNGAGTSINISIDAGENVVCTFTNVRLPENSVTVIKDVQPDDQSLWDFTLIGPDGGIVNDLPDGGSFTFTDRAPGVYTLVESVQGGYTLASINCNVPVTPVENGVQFTVGAGDSVVCTFVNTQDASITIIKDANPNAPVIFSFNGSLGVFGLEDDGDLTDGQANSIKFGPLAPGTYLVTEIGLPFNWELVTITCTDPSGNTTASKASATATIVLGAGEDVVCTFTNRIIPAVLPAEEPPAPAPVSVPPVSLPKSGGTPAYGADGSGMTIVIALALGSVLVAIGGWVTIRSSRRQD